MLDYSQQLIYLTITLLVRFFDRAIKVTTLRSC